MPDSRQLTRVHAAVGSDPATARAAVADLTLIVPTYREEHRLGDSLERLAAFLSGPGSSLGDVEVVVVDGASPDRTVEVARARAGLFERFEVMVLDGNGKGRQVREAMLRCRGRNLLFMDADLATPLHHVGAALEIAEAGSPVVIGVRDLSAIHDSRVRQMLSTGGNLLVRKLLLPDIRDSQCGFKLFRKDAARDIFARQTMMAWSFDMEVLAIARRLGYEITTLAIDDWQDVENGSFHAETHRAALATLKELFAIRRNLRRGAYDPSADAEHAR